MRHALSDTYGHANADFNADFNANSDGHGYGYGYGYSYRGWYSDPDLHAWNKLRYNSDRRQHRARNDGHRQPRE